jgi:WD40 repeat protein
MSKYHFLFVVLALFIWLGFGQESTFGLRTALMGPKDQGRVEAVALSPDKKILVFATGYGYNYSTIYVIDAKTGQTLRTNSECGGVYSIEFIDNSEMFIRGSSLADGGGGFGCILNVNPEVPLKIQGYDSGDEIDAQTVQFCPASTHHDPYVTCDAMFFSNSLSPNQKILADVEKGSLIKILDVETLEPLHTITGYEGITTSKFSPDNKLLGIMFNGVNFAIFNATTDEKVSEYIVTQEDVRSHSGRIIFSPDSKYILFSFSYETTNTDRKSKTVVWDVYNQREHLTFDYRGNFSFNEDGTFLFKTSKNLLEVWNISTGQQFHTFKTPYEDYVSIFTALNNQYLIAHSSYLGKANDIIMWDLQTGEEKHRIVGASELSVQGDIFITGNNKGEAKIWDIATGKELRAYSSNYPYTSEIKFDESSNYLASAVGPKATVLEIEIGKVHEKLFPVTSQPYSTSEEITLDLAFSDKSNTLIASRGFSEYEFYEYTSLHFWNFENNKLRIILPELKFPFSSDPDFFNGYGPDGSYISSSFSRLNVVGEKSIYIVEGYEDGTAKLFDRKTGKPLYTFSGHEPSQSQPVSISVSFDNQYVATAGYLDGKIQIWETATGKLVKTLWADEGKVYGVRFSSGGNFLITTYSKEGMSRKIWNITNEQLVNTPIPESDEEYGVFHIFNPNDTLVATHGRNSIYLWNSNTGELIHEFQQTGNVTFSPDGKLLVIGSSFPGLNNAVSIFGAEDNSPIFLTADISYQDTLAKDDAELIINSSFSVGSAGWLLENDAWAGNTLLNFNTSPGYAALGVSENGDRQDRSIGKLSQVIPLPENAQKATLSFWYSISTEETDSSIKDSLHCQLGGDEILASFDFSNLDATKDYKEVKLEQLDVSAFAGQRLYLSCYAETDETYPTVFRLDDFSLRLEP